MIPEVEQTGWMVAVYWLLLFPIAVVVQVRVTHFWADDGPGTLFEAVRSTLLMSLVVFLTYDLSGYMFARCMEMPQLGFAFPNGYTYWNWIREPLCLKWQVLGFVPLIRYLPVLFALMAGTMTQMLWWHIPFRQAVLAFINQIVLTVFAMALLSLVLSFFVGIGDGTTTRNNERRSTAAQRRDQNGPDRANDQTGVSTAPGGLLGLQARAREIGRQKSPFINWAWERWESFNRFFETGYVFAEPVTRYLPLPVQDFLNGGGWLIGGPALAIFGWYAWRRRQRRTGNRKSNPVETNSPVP
jgi:hypothetical protein